LTLNFGARWDIFYASFDKENQPSPRVNLIWEPTDSTTLHAGYARYFTPPALENLAGTSVTRFDGTSNESEVKTADPAKAERSHYFDAGISQKVTKGLQLGVDAYYKIAQNQLDDGLFGQSLILSQFNYREGRVYGVEFTGTYTAGGFSSYANIAVSQAQGKDVTSGQFLFGQDDLDYIHKHWVFLDHDQLLSGSFGISYLLKEREDCATRFYADALYGSGLRTDKDTPSGTIPNGGTVAASYSLNLGAEQTFKVGRKQYLKARLDVVNITDNVYELRDGGGIGVNAAQFGMRRAFFGSISYVF
jgi:outer membrane receptor protein involved in Fe transport